MIFFYESEGFTISKIFKLNQSVLGRFWGNFKGHFGVRFRRRFERNGILLPKLFWPTVRKNCSSDQEKVLKFEAEGQEFAKMLRSLDQFIQKLFLKLWYWINLKTHGHDLKVYALLLGSCVFAGGRQVNRRILLCHKAK